jgi:hypothetical protein
LSWGGGGESSKAKLAREASALSLRKRLEKIMSASRNSMAKRNEKKRLEKEALPAMYINLTK